MLRAVLFLFFFLLFVLLWKGAILLHAHHRIQLFKADPSGWYAGYRAAAIGQKGEEANNIFEKKLRSKPALSANEPILTGLIALQSALGVDLKANEVEVGVCSKDAPRFRTLSEAEVRVVPRPFDFFYFSSRPLTLMQSDRCFADTNGGQRLRLASWHNSDNFM